jgi:hypothetical protein
MRNASQEGTTGGREKEKCLLIWEDVHCYLPRSEGYPSGMLALFAAFLEKGISLHHRPMAEN